MCSSPGYRSSANQKQAACSMILIVPVTLHAVVRRYPQLAMKCHYLLGATGLASISYHVMPNIATALDTVLVLGPYGRPPDLARFGIVLLIVEDIGIARVFSLIQILVLAREQHRAMVRKLIVVWQMET